MKKVKEIRKDLNVKKVSDSCSIKYKTKCGLIAKQKGTIYVDENTSTSNTIF